MCSPVCGENSHCEEIGELHECVCDEGWAKPENLLTLVESDEEDGCQEWSYKYQHNSKYEISVFENFVERFQFVIQIA